ncbi:MAG TPA: hypothetical protein VK141_05535 [Nitrosomonas sp.]|nr:hypothetical protein [Nitrosomonas sp.]
MKKRNTLRLIISSFLLILSFGCKHTTEPAGESVPHNKILFDSKRNGSYQLYMMNPDGTSIEQVTHEADPYIAGRWSKDAVSFVCELAQGTEGHQIAMGAVNGGVHLVQGFGENPLLSPDNQYLAVNSWMKICGIFSLKSDTLALRFMNAVVTDWSMDGKQLLLTRWLTPYITKPYIAVAGFPDTSNVRRIGPEGAYNGVWNPEGNLIAYVIRPDSISSIEIYTMDNNGENIHHVATNNSPSYDFSARWLPDGKEILFVSDGKLMIVSKEGGTPRVILNDSTIFRCDWSW